MFPSPLTSRSQVIILMIAAGAAGAAMAFLFDDSCQQDGGLHFLYAKWAWTHPLLFVGVWSRPLFTAIYAFPALIGYRAARIFTVIVCLGIGWQTAKLAADLKIPRPPLAIALIWLQPSFFLFCADNMTEPVFALVYVIALRLHRKNRIKAGMIAASLLIMARPEGFFLGILWAIRMILARRRFKIDLLLLATGSIIWWLAAYILSGDPLFIIHNWPSNWPLTGTIYGAAGLIAFPARLPEIVGPFLLWPFLHGLIALLRAGELRMLTSSFLLFFVLHTILRAYGLLGSAGYPRYLIAISPAIALITLIGWDGIARFFSSLSRGVAIGCAALVILVSLYTNFIYADGAENSRDARAITIAHSWFQSNQSTQRPVSQLIWCQSYSSILFQHDPWENPNFTLNHERDLAILREYPPGTLAVWDDKAGPKWLGLTAIDFEAAGFERLYAESFRLNGYLLDRDWFGYGGPRDQTIYLLYKVR